MKFRRLMAFMMDLFIASFIASIIFSTPLFKEENEFYSNNLEQVVSTYNELLNSGSGEVDNDRLIDISYDFCRNSATLLIIQSFAIILYFGIIAFFFKGKTLGKKLMKLQIVSVNDEGLNPTLFLLREIIKTNVLFNVISTLAIIYTSKSTWLNINAYCSDISNFITLLIVGFIAFRKDGRGLHDLIGKTQVISTKK